MSEAQRDVLQRLSDDQRAVAQSAQAQSERTEPAAPAAEQAADTPTFIADTSTAADTENIETKTASPTTPPAKARTASKGPAAT
jgi:hypothetical protein